MPAIVGLPADADEDNLKALGAAAASSGAVALFHAIGLTPEAPDLQTATGGLAPELVLHLSADDLRAAARSLSDVADGAPLAAVTLGTPHFSLRRIRPADASPARRARPASTSGSICSRATLEELRARGWEERLKAAGVTLVVDTCTYVTTLMRAGDGAVMTNSGKCAYYAPGNLGVDVAYGSLDRMHRLGARREGRAAVSAALSARSRSPPAQRRGRRCGSTNRSASGAASIRRRAASSTAGTRSGTRMSLAGC